MLVKNFCNREVVVARGEESAQAIAQLMRKYHVGDVIIIKKDGDINKPVGIITDRDIVLEIVALNVPIESCAAKDIMSTDLVTVKENDGFWETLQHMRQHGIRRLPVVNESGGLVGIICADDYFELLSEELASIVKLIYKEQSTEMEKRTVN